MSARAVGCAVADVGEGDDIDGVASSVVGDQDVIAVAVTVVLVVGQAVGIALQVIDELDLGLELALVNAGVKDGGQGALGQGSLRVNTGSAVAQGVVPGISGELDRKSVV